MASPSSPAEARRRPAGAPESPRLRARAASPECYAPECYDKCHRPSAGPQAPGRGESWTRRGDGAACRGRRSGLSTVPAPRWSPKSRGHRCGESFSHATAATMTSAIHAAAETWRSAMPPFWTWNWTQILLALFVFLYARERVRRMKREHEAWARDTAESRARHPAVWAEVDHLRAESERNLRWWQRCWRSVALRATWEYWFLADEEQREWEGRRRRG